MRNYHFIVEEYDHQAPSCSKDYKMHKHGRNVNHAYQRLQAQLLRNKDLDYSYKILTLNQYNRMKQEAANRKLWNNLIERYWLIFVYLTIIAIVLTCTYIFT